MEWNTFNIYSRILIKLSATRPYQRINVCGRTGIMLYEHKSIILLFNTLSLMICCNGSIAIVRQQQRKCTEHCANQRYRLREITLYYRGLYIDDIRFCKLQTFKCKTFSEWWVNQQYTNTYYQRHLHRNSNYIPPYIFDKLNEYKRY